MRATAREERGEGEFPGVGPAWQRPAGWAARGFQNSSVRGRGERGGWGISEGQPWGLKSHTVPQGGVGCGRAGDKPEGTGIGLAFEASLRSLLA